MPPSEAEFRRLFTTTPLKRGGAINDISVFNPPISYRRGGGVLSALSGIARRVFPFIVKTMKPMAKQFGTSVINDVISGKRDFKTSVKKHGVRALKKTGSQFLKKSSKVDKQKRRISKTKRGKGYKRSVFDIV